MILLSCPDTSVSDAPSLSSYLSFPPPPSSPDPVFSTRAPRKLVAVYVFLLLVYNVGGVCFFTPLPVRPLADLPPGSFAPTPWTIHPH